VNVIFKLLSKFTGLANDNMICTFYAWSDILSLTDGKGELVGLNHVRSDEEITRIDELEQLEDEVKSNPFAN